ncbi:MAG TPA: DUF5658 family protein [Planctomycetota bacterium]|jgi:hypothetical protein|nr:DUF5658 family protein [Planctomycetota bacterium]
MDSQPEIATSCAPPSSEDRRRRVVSRHLFFGGRRRASRVNSYVDIYGPGLLAATCAILGLNVLDSILTVIHIGRGGAEMNPLMRWLLDQGQVPFLFWKSLVVGVGVVFLCMHKNFRLGRAGLGLALSSYGGLLGYHIWLIGQAWPIV